MLVQVDRQIRQPTNYFIASLAVTDILIGTVSMPFFTVGIPPQNRAYIPMLCQVLVSLGPCDLSSSCHISKRDESGSLFKHPSKSLILKTIPKSSPLLPTLFHILHYIGV